MGKKITSILVSRHIPALIFGNAFVFSSTALVYIEKFDVSRLNAFGLVSKIYLTGIKNGLIFSTAILFLSLVFLLFLGRYFYKIRVFLEHFYLSLSDIKKGILIFAICLSFVFISHSGNILSGYFDADDFDVIHIN